jgi:hypothetical protein
MSGSDRRLAPDRKGYRCTRCHLCSHANESHRRPQRGPVDGIGVREWRAHGSEPVLARDGARVDL